MLRQNCQPLVLLMLRKLRVPQSAVMSLAQTWENTIQHIRTQYGISPESYANSSVALLFGPGQGSTVGPFSLAFLHYSDP